MPNGVPNSQGATISFDGVELGVLVGFSPSYAVANVSEVTSHRSQVIGQGTASRVVKQLNCTSIEPGTITARFLGAADLNRNDVGRPGVLSIQWPGGAIVAQAFLSDLQPDFQRGELRQWAATFTFTGF